MGEPIGMMIEIGGKLSAKKMGDLISAIDDDLQEWSSPLTAEELKTFKGKLTIYGVSNYGECDELKKFLRENKMSYIHTIEGKYEYEGEVSFWNPKMDKEVSMMADQQGNPTVKLDALKNLEKYVTLALDHLWGDNATVGENLEKIKFEIIDKLPPFPPKKIPVFSIKK